MKIVKSSIVISAGLLLLISIFLFLPINSPFGMKEIFCTTLKSGLKVKSVSVDKLTINGLGKIKIKGLAISGIERQWKYNITVPTMTIRIHPLKFVGSIKKEQIVIGDMLKGLRKINYSQDPLLHLNDYLVLYNKQFSKLKDLSAISANLNFLNLKDETKIISEKTDVGISFNGKFRKDIRVNSNRIILSGCKLNNFNVSIKISKNKLLLKKCYAKIGNGNIQSEATFSLKKNSVQKGSLLIKNIRLEDIFKDTGYGMWSGKIDRINFILKPSILITYDSIKGEGNILITDAKLRKTPIQIKAAKILKTSLINEIAFNKISTFYSYQSGKINITNFISDGYPMSIKAFGTIDIFNKRQRLKIHGHFKKESSKHFKPLIWNTLVKENDGRSFDCNISGSYKYPTLSFNIKFIGKAINNFFKTVFN